MSLLNDSTAAPSQLNANLGRIYPDPFRTYAQSLMPRTNEEALRWCEGFWFGNGTYSRAMLRVVAYFLTTVEVSDVSDDKRKKYARYLNETLDVKVILSNLGADFMAYGNSFSSPYLPFKRLLRCDTCRTERPIEDVDYEFEKGKFKWSCQHCQAKASADRPIDRRVTDEAKLTIKRWSPHEIKIREHPISGAKIFLWDPPRDIVQRIQKGDKFILRDFPWEMIQAILAGKMFQFAPNIIFHMSQETLSGIRSGGWGLSASIANFNQGYYVQTAKLYNSVLMHEYIVPFRVISPARGSNPGGDPLTSMSVGGFNNKVLSMLREHRRSPGGYYAVPFPIEYQALGAEGIQVSTYEHIMQATDEMLNAAGVPAELYKGTVQFQALPTALRLFQQTWPHLKSQFDKWLDWLMNHLSMAFNWERARARLQDVTLADDIEKKNLLLQLMAGQRVSSQTALSPMGIDPEEELQRMLDEQRSYNEAMAKFQQEQQQRQMLQERFAPTASPVPGGPQPGGDPTITPQDVQMQAQQEAQRLLAMPYESRRSDMARLKKSNPTLHAMVKAEMENTRSQAQSIGQQQVLQQGMAAPQPGQPMQ